MCSAILAILIQIYMHEGGSISNENAYEGK